MCSVDRQNEAGSLKSRPIDLEIAGRLHRQIPAMPTGNTTGNRKPHPSPPLSPGDRTIHLKERFENADMKLRGNAGPLIGYPNFVAARFR